jgi:hypothetical protein
MAGSHGGKRPGAGGPPGPRPGSATEWLQIRVTSGMKDDLKKRAAAQGVSISKYVLQQLGV